MSIELNEEQERPTVPPQALLLSLLSLWVPILSSSLFPSWTTDDVGVLVWLLALIPPFLLSYYKGWKGASLALAGGMAAFALSQVAVILSGVSVPRPEIMLGINIVLIGVAMGSGVLASLFQKSLSEAEQMALTDPGTGLPNRRHAMLHLQRAFGAAQRGSSLAVILFDLDRFKQVNDTYGHAAGDEALRVFAGILSTHTRTMNLSARFGGEEFIFILDDGEPGGATIVAERVLRQLRAHEFAWGRVTVSAGVSQYEPGMASPDVLIAAADQALYRAKAQGRDRVIVLGRQGASEDTAAELIEPTPQEDSAVGRGELVLVVDDDPAVLRTLTRGLRRRRYQPIEASDPQRALEIARGLGEPVDMIVTDVVMPGMSGFRLVEMLMEIQPTVRALYISGYSKEEVRWSGVPGTVKAFLPKPLTIDALASAVRRGLDLPLPRRAGTPGAGAIAGTTAAPPAEGTVPTPSRVTAERYGLRRPPSSAEARLIARTAQLEEAQGEILLRLAWTAEYRDDATGSHAERVARLAGLLAAEMGVSEGEVGRIEQAALLHDLGKIAIPDAILRKPGALTPTELEVMHRHCLVGAHILAGSRHPLLQEAERIARGHHERWDGGGYPDGLAGEEIPLSARITAVADAFDTMTHDRPYRAKVSRAEALSRIREAAGTQFDPRVVVALSRLASARRLDGLEQVEVAGEWKGGPVHHEAGAPAGGG